MGQIPKFLVGIKPEDQGAQRGSSLNGEWGWSVSLSTENFVIA